MESFSMSVKEWGLHTVLHRDLSAAEAGRLSALLEDAAGGFVASGRRCNLIVDLRGTEAGHVHSLHVAALFAVLKRTEGARCSLIVHGLPQGAALERAALDRGLSAGLRVFAGDGRDRAAVAAAYKWALDGTEPCRPAKGEILPFIAAATVRRVALPLQGLRRAS